MTGAHRVCRLTGEAAGDATVLHPDPFELLEGTAGVTVGLATR